MRTLNLVDLDKSDIKYKIINYPDGQKDIVVDSKIEIGLGGMMFIDVTKEYKQF